MVGRKVQQYQFLEKLGAGGMGEIYRAQDTRLNRFVAIKVLTGSSSNDPDRRRRFIQEAQAASALNHPNIVTIHDIVTDDGAQYMVLEHIQGKTLADLIPKGGLRVPQVLKLTMQMTDALQTAHAAGIIHRDLKPGNVMVTDTGLVKILDFGLAKLADPSPVTQDNDVTRTIAEAPLTVEGSIIGTVSYMSPEQAEGKKVDTRSDIFSLGVVLYEMITGNRAFQADTAVGTLSAILRDSPRPITDVAPDVPPRLAQVVDRCLAKSADDRFQTMKDMHVALGALKHESDSGVLYRSMIATASQMQLPEGKGASPSVTSVSGIAAPASTNIKWMIGGGVAVAALAIGGYVASRPQPVAPAPVAPAPVEAAKSGAPAPQPTEELLTNDGIIQMIGAKVPLDVIYSQIRSAPNKFNLSASEVIRLTNSKVPLPVIEAMRNPKSIPETKTLPETKAPAVVAAAIPPAASTPKTTVKGPESPKSDPVSKADAKEKALPVPVTLPPVPTPPVAPPAAFKEVLVVDGTPFVIALAHDVLEDSKPGMQLRFTVVNDLKVGDTVAVAKGAIATGQIVQGKRTFGKMTLGMVSVTGVDGKPHNIRALSAKNSKPERPVETGVKSKVDKAVADAGTQYIAYVDGDLRITVPARPR